MATKHIPGLLKVLEKELTEKVSHTVQVADFAVGEVPELPVGTLKRVAGRWWLGVQDGTKGPLLMLGAVDKAQVRMALLALPTLKPRAPGAFQADPDKAPDAGLPDALGPLEEPVTLAPLISPTWTCPPPCDVSGIPVGKLCPLCKSPALKADPY